MNKFIITAIGMQDDQVRKLEEELNSNVEDKYIWIIDKNVTADNLYVKDTEKWVHIISAPTMDKIQIAKFSEEINDKNSTKKYFVFNQPVKVSTIWDEEP